MKEITIDQISAIVCDEYKTTPGQVMIESQKREFVEVRQVIHYFCVKYKAGSKETIGQKIGNLNRSTVNHSYKTVGDLIQISKSFASKMWRIEMQIIDLVEDFEQTVLKEYAREHGTLQRSASDLSPLEKWVIFKLRQSLIKLQLNLQS